MKIVLKSSVRFLLLYVIAMLFLFSGCSREDVSGVQKFGKEVLFEAMPASMPSLSTKSSDASDESVEIYCNFLTGENPDISQSDTLEQSSQTRYSSDVIRVGSKYIERLDWVEEDRITVFQEHTSTSLSEYKVTSVDPSSQRSKASLAPVSGNGLQWKEGSDNTFMSVYPSLSDKNISLSQWIKGASASTSEISGGYSYFPSTQYVYYDALSKDYKPDMKLAYMLSAVKVASSQVPKSNLGMEYYTDFNAIEFQLVKPSTISETIKIKSATLMANVAIAMSAPSRKTTITFSGGRPVTSMEDAGPTGQPVMTEQSITLYFKQKPTNTDYDFPELTESEALKFTFITMPVAVPELTLELLVDIDGTESTRTLKLQKTVSGTIKWISLPKYQKMVVSNLKVPGGWEYYLSQPDNLTVRNNGSSVSAGFRFQSYRIGGGTDKKIIPVKAEFSLDGTSFYSYNDSSIPSDLKSLLTSNPFTSTREENGYYANINLATNTSHRSSTTQDLRSRADVSTLPGYGSGMMVSGSSYANLALYDFVTETIRPSTEPQTANCYVIRRPGHYAFPIVYGNSLDYRKVPSAPYYNTSSYAPTPLFNSTAFLTPFLNSKDEGIVSPWVHYDVIKDDTMTGDQTADLLANDYEAVIVWQDVLQSEQFITELTIGNSSDHLLGIEGASKVPYVCFNVPAEKIQEGNAVIGIRIKDEVEILWSWHIWLCAEQMVPQSVVNYDGVITDLLPVPLGWNLDGYPERSFYVRLSQTEGPGTGGGSPKVFKITQPELKRSGATYYEWGRKDPFLPSDGTNKNKAFSSPGGYLIDGKNTSAASGANSGLFTTTTQTTPKLPSKSAAYAIQHPYRGCFPAWIYERNLTNLWNATEHYYGVLSPSLSDKPVKTVYDPCPPGYSIPQKTFATGFTTTGTESSDKAEFNADFTKGEQGWNTGWWLKKNPSDTNPLFFQALGSRGLAPTSGLSMVGESGYFATCALHNANTLYDFRFTADVIKPVASVSGLSGRITAFAASEY